MALFGGVLLPGKPDLDNLRVLDKLPIPMIRRMQRAGMAIDREYFHQLSSEFAAEMQSLERDISSYIPPDRLHEFSARSAVIEEEQGSASLNPRSAEQIGALLWDMLGVGAGQSNLKRTGQGKVSTGKKNLELVKNQHPVVSVILRYREVSKLKSTYTDTLPLLAKHHPRSNCCPICEWPHDAETWRVHGQLGTTRADTGRINHQKPNLGNVPTRTDDGQRVQAGFVASPGKLIVARDLSQIELRDLAHLSVCQAMLATYAADGDIHDMTARKVFNLPADEKPDKIKHRMAAKRTGFSIMNGTTDKGLFMQLVMDYGISKLPVPDWLTLEWCRWFIEQFLAAYPEIRDYFARMWYRARRYEMAWDSFGRVKLIPEVRSTHAWVKESGLRQAQNMPITSLAAGQLKLAMGALEETLLELLGAGVWAMPAMTIHDSIMVEVGERHAGVVLETMGRVMDAVMDDVDTGEPMLRVPIKSDGESMSYWKK